jgi:hypothetical protein
MVKVKEIVARGDFHDLDISVADYGLINGLMSLCQLDSVISILGEAHAKATVEAIKAIAKEKGWEV